MKNMEDEMKRFRFTLLGSALLLCVAVVAVAATGSHGVTETFQKTCALAPDGKVSLGMHVDYILTVPRNSSLEEVKIVNGQIDISGLAGNVTVSTVNGSVDARDLSGGCEFETANGKVDAEFTSLASGSDVRLKSVNGALMLRLPDNPDARIKASTTVGNISNDFGLESTRESDEHSVVRIGDALSGTLGKGSASIEMHTVNGSIDILKSNINR